MKNIKYGEITITERAQAFPCTRKCNHSRKHNCNEVSKWRHSIGSSSSYPCQSRYDVGTGLLIMSSGKKHNSNACSKQLAKSQMACKKSGFDCLLDLLKVCAQPLQLNLRELTRVIHQSRSPAGVWHYWKIDRCVRPFHNSTFIDTFYQWVHGTLLYMRHQVDVQSVETKLNTTWYDCAAFVLRVSMLTL